ncbi:MAG TPA: oligosaccharide flippase family protein, partial [Segetibacter sp.]
FGRYKNTTVITRTEYLYYALCYIVGIQLTSFFTALFYAGRNFFLPNFLMVLLNVIVIFIIPKQEGTDNTDTALIIKLYFAFFLLTGIVLAAAFIIKKRSWQNWSLPAFFDLKILVRYALISLAANVIFFLVYRVDYWFVKKFCSPEDLGNYIQVSKLGQMLLIIPSIISSVVFPHTAGGTMDSIEMKENIMRIGRITTVLYLILFVLIFVFGRWLFPFVFGSTFQRMFIPFLLILPGIWALSNLSILSAYFAGVNRVKVNLQGAALALTVIFIADLIFIPRYGMIAAAIISTAGYTVNFIYSFFVLQREHKVSLSQYWSINKEDIKWLKKFIP